MGSFVLRSLDFGRTWDWTTLPTQLQAASMQSSFAADPTDPNTIHAVTHSCLSNSTDQGLTWSNCSSSIRKQDHPLSSLHIKDSQPWFSFAPGMSRSGLKTAAQLGRPFVIFPSI